MTTKERYEIDKRVALALGWTQTHGHAGREPGCGIGSPSLLFPRYSSNPKYADVVRLEIEKRGWGRRSRALTYPVGRRYSEWIIVGNTGTWADKGYRGDSDDSPHVALCLAFLDACEAQSGDARP